MTMKHVVLSVFLVPTVMAFSTVADGSEDDRAAGKTPPDATVYVAKLKPLNSDVTGLKTSGRARFVVTGQTLTITVDVKNAPANIAHWQHFHGFKGDRAATCSKPTADKNGDGVIDVTETGKASGTTMVPFNAHPAHMKVAQKTYPKAGEDGTYHYEKTVPLKKLKKAFAKAFGGAELDLARRVVYIHGVPADTDLPASVASLGSIPSHVTIPIACGDIQRVNDD